MNISHQQEFSIEYARENFNQVIESAQKEAVTLVQNEQKFFLINENILESWLETFEILKDQEILEDIKIAREEYHKGETLTMDDIFS
ncbi:prevent-host-death family protein [Geminocystis sp. CENA526]|uniref:prevent-host-death family protein n=1 Tax=Geminocystis sp. CENA526 TaxID=1355871 RepID=UPI003D6F4F13